MSTTATNSYLADRRIRMGAGATMIAFLGCLATHVVVGVGLVAATAWLAAAEHALLAALAVAIAFTGWAVWKHRRGGCAHAATDSGSGSKGGVVS